MRHRLLLPAVVGSLVAGCTAAVPISPEDLVYPSAPIFVGGSIYFLAPASRQIVEVIPGPQGEDAAYTDLEEYEVRTFEVGEGVSGLQLTPDGGHLLTLSHDLTDALVLKVPGEACEGEGDAGCPVFLPARPLHDRLALSPDGRYALSYIDEGSANAGTSAVVNLNEIGIYDLDAGSALFSTIGFAPQDFAFTADGTRAVVLTASRVAVVDLATGEATTRDLTLGTDSRVSPMDVVLTADDHYALVTVAGSSDLYTFDLTQPSLPINILGLSGAPMAMVRSQDGASTLVLGSGGIRLDVIRHADLSVDTVALPSPMSRLMAPDGADYAALYSPYGAHQLYYVDIATGRLTAYLLDNPVSQVHASPGGDALVLYYTPDYEDGDALSESYAVAVLNLGQGDRQPNPVLTSSDPLGAAFDMRSGAGAVYTALEGYDEGIIARVDLSDYGSSVVVTPPSIRALGQLPSDGRIVVIHKSSAGFLTLFDPVHPEDVQFIHGFMLTDLL